MRAVLLILALAWPTWSAAAPCVGPALDRPLPGAQDVRQVSADVPTARFPGLWQQGRVDGLVYRIFGDGTAVLSDDLGAPRWQIRVDCAEPTCRTAETGAPDAGADRVAAALGRCLTGQAVTAADLRRAAPAFPTGLPDDVPDQGAGCPCRRAGHRGRSGAAPFGDGMPARSGAARRHARAHAAADVAGGRTGPWPR
ncbi:hypothetical protein [Paracoccus sp. PAMC 22219]|uniref:hypothetical protein n=1 Tax=Paracoccus sp. PAMC 22219 TaxID=1569209 RepID=UPI0005A8A988|nr:hypothetical protein [Paracoccus sp. PAMC 22219]